MNYKETPLMRQYFSIKETYPDHILFFRLGDFYEMFGEDAITASKILNIALTTRDKKKEDAIPLCGVPYHSARIYIKRLLDKGLKVAICEQLEDPKKAKGIVKRDVVRLISSGTVMESDLLNEKEHNFLASVFPGERGLGLAFLDLTTGEFRTTEHLEDDRLIRLQGEISRLEPKEILFPSKFKNDKDLMRILSSFSIELSPVDIVDFGLKEASDLLKTFYDLNQIDVLGLNDKPLSCLASSYIIHYLKQTQKNRFCHIMPPQFYGLSDQMILDHTTLTNLELVRSSDTGAREGTLLNVLDRTSTPMGARCIKDWILHPLLMIESIQNRLDAVEELVNKLDIRERIKGFLKNLYDLERICGRISLRMASPQNLLALKSSIPLIQKIKGEGGCFETRLLKIKINQCHLLQDVFDLIDNTLEDDPSSKAQKTGIIKRNVSEELDRLYEITYNGRKWIADLESKERKRTGISSLKIGYNKVFGYYIEITKSNLANVPAEYIRKQTLVNCERFITEDLKHFENEVLGAEERILKLEREIFDNLLDSLVSHIPSIQETAKAIAQMDCLISFAEVAAKQGYIKPNINLSLSLKIKQGRHPVLETRDNERPFVPNDTFIDCLKQQLIILTGPNMAGKSTYMRQVALIVLMAQIGSFVPAKSAQIGLVDRIFTRVGASDRLYKGQSTFMVEMIETANILHQASRRSLIIMDEIGRGTSTYDGISIAWAVAEYIHSNKNLGARTLFATHYHELTELPNYLERARNYNISVDEEKGEVVFLYHVVEGGSDRSYGVHVAKLASLPKEVIERACQIMEDMEDKKGIDFSKSKKISSYKEVYRPTQLSLFSDPETNILMEIKALDQSRLSPLKALKKLNEWKQTLS
ncbi:MAG: DNA mismatch repair protein MutS [bacterium]